MAFEALKLPPTLDHDFLALLFIRNFQLFMVKFFGGGSGALVLPRPDALRVHPAPTALSAFKSSLVNSKAKPE